METMIVDEAELRCCDRVPTNADIVVRKVKDFRYASVLKDFSPHGCRVELIDRVDRGDIVWVGLPGLETLYSTVRWANEWTAGIEFDRPINPAVFDHFAERLTSEAA